MYEYDDSLNKVIPPNFELNKYKETAMFTATDWWAALMARERVEWLLRSGYIEPGSEPEATSYNLANIMEGATKEQCIYEGDEPVKNLDKDTYTALNGESFPSLNFAQINLKIPDDMLLEAFMKWVNEERLKLGVKAKNKRISKTHFRNWHDARILQYLDINQWHRINNLKPKKEEIEMILFPEYVQGKDLKTTIKHIDELYSKGYKSALIAQVHN